MAQRDKQPPLARKQGHQPLNTLSSQQAPTFEIIQGTRTAGAQLLPGHSEAEYSLASLGHSSSLFDTPNASVVDLIAHVKPPPASMVNERKPGQTSSAPTAPARLDLRQPAAAATPVSQQPALYPQLPTSTGPAEFGKASPLRNPLSSNNVFRQPVPGQRRSDPNSIFNQNQSRAEHHRPPSAQSKLIQPFRIPSPAGQPSQSSQPSQKGFVQPRPIPIPVPSQPTSNSGFHLPGQKRQQIQQARPHATITSDFFEVARPSNAAPKSIQPAQRPIFNSIGPNTTFQPFEPLPRTTVDLTKDDDGFDPDAALKDDHFGSIDPHAYVDPTQASDNIKALLEGAFDDDDDKPKARLRKRAKKVDMVESKSDNISLAEKLARLRVKEEDAKPGAMGTEEDEEEEEEDGTVDGLTVKLLPHQVEGVAWMIDKEIGERKKNGVLPKGGILADDMGLGKTVQSVALILTNARPNLDAKPDNPKVKLPGKEVGKGTLVVAPLALIKQWEAEIKSKVERSHALRVLVHHGPSRTKSHLELKKYDVVITTYQILASEHAGSSERPDGIKVGCYGVHWYRVILDEAHSIKNRNAKSTQACYALRSWYRWCLTGTPMQNNLDELQSLICFLQIKPYNDLRHWKDHITGPMKNGKGQYAIKRIQYFLKACMKRRTKDILKQEGALNFGGKAKPGEQKGEGMKIVERTVDNVVCELDASERAFYDRLSERADSRLKDMMTGDKADYIGALVLLLRLRQACNHPQLLGSAMKKDKDALSTAGLDGAQSPRKASRTDDNGMDDLVSMLGGLGVATKNCDVCQIELQKSEVANGAVRCDDCEGDLAAQKAGKKHRTHKSGKAQKTSRVAASTGKTVANMALKRRNRKVIDDSDDDDDDDEGGGDWLVSQSQRSAPDLGKAGGTDDEDAEGTGISLGADDSASNSDSEDNIKARKKREVTNPTSIVSDGSSLESDNSDNGSNSDGNEHIPHSRPSAGPPPSTKIRRLLRILHADTPSHKVIVFSQFTSMLDLIAPHLTAAHLRFARYDGSMRNDAREASLHALRHDASTRVLLCSLKCGSLGLNLTAASRVVLVEPFWNPFVEEQAIDRVHRLNQTRDVRVYKLTVKDTVEERILELQEKKRALATAALEGGKAVAKLSVKDLLGLFGRNPDEAIVVDRMEPWDRQAGALLRERPRGSGEAVVGAGAVAAAPASDDRRRFVDKGRPRRSEDPVYGRR